MKRVLLPLAAVAIALAITAGVSAQDPGFERLPSDRLDVSPPSARVRGEIGKMSVLQQPCRTVPLADARRSIVDVAAQEWAFFGFRIVDESNPLVRGRRTRGSGGFRFGPRNEEAERVASSIAGYWAATPEGAWVVGRQNDAWNGPSGTGARWVEPWSAAFISWVMCEAGLGDTGQFRRAVAHHVYIDQAIRARDGRAPQAAYAAYDVGEQPIAPGDLLCTAQRPEYRRLAERRRQMGTGARTHCDVVVTVDQTRQRVLAIGGNVRGTVSLKMLPAVVQDGTPMRPLDRSAVGARPMFAHLKLRAEAIDPRALDSSPTIESLACAIGSFAVNQVTDARLVAAGVIADRC